MVLTIMTETSFQNTVEIFVEEREIVVHTVHMGELQD
ncbi:hypothetical protein ES708_18224 [subsurface metagenome]